MPPLFAPGTATFLKRMRNRMDTDFIEMLQRGIAVVGLFTLLLVGLMLSATGGWTIPIWVLIATTAAMVAAGLIAYAPGYVDDELKP